MTPQREVMRRRQRRVTHAAATFCLCMSLMPITTGWLLHVRPIAPSTTKAVSRPTTQVCLWSGWRGDSGGGGENEDSNSDSPLARTAESEEVASAVGGSVDGNESTEQGAAVPVKQEGEVEGEKVVQVDDGSMFDGFEGFHGKRVSYNSQPKARQNLLFEMWRLRSAEDIALLYKGQHQYGASRRLQEAVNEQVACILGMYLREPDFQSRMQVLAGDLVNLFFKLQMLGYMFANADRLLSSTSSLNLLDSASPQPPVGTLQGQLTVSVIDGKNVTLNAQDVVGGLVKEVEGLREKLNKAKISKEAARQGDLTSFIRNLSEDEQRALTEGIPDHVLDCMRKLVDNTLARVVPTVGNQWSPTISVVIPSKGVFAELLVMMVVYGVLLRVTEEDQLQQLKLFSGAIPF